MKKIYISLVCLSALGLQKTNAQANQQLSNLTSPTAINISLLPGTKNSINLGSATKTWKNVYADGAIYMGGARFIAYKIGIGINNVAIGVGVMKNNTAGTDNTAIGDSALSNNNLGGLNTAAGNYALYSNQSGGQNTATGAYALYSNVDGSYNLANGISALYSNTNGTFNTAVGYEALYSNTSGYDNIAIGLDALFKNTKGSSDIAQGSGALYNNTTGSFNIAEGIDAMSLNNTGNDMIGIGDSALFGSNGAANCTAVGSQAGWKNTTGSNNTYFGYHAGNTVTTGSSNTIIGYGADVGSSTFSNTTALGNLAIASGSNRVRIGNSSVTSIGGQVGWTNFSDERIKTNIKQDVPGLAFINLLKPVTYNFDLNKEEQIFKRKDSIEWKEEYDIQKIKFTGFLAQEVEAAAKKINYDFSGVDKPANDKDVYGLRYSDFVVPLIKAVQELSKMNNTKDSVIQIQNDKIDDLETRLAKVETMLNVLSASSSSQQQVIKPGVANLLQNSPNPFSNTTTISYSIPQQFSSAKIIITDKIGNALKQINIANNKGSVTIDASTLTNGAYQYSLIADGKIISSKQMEVIK